MQQQEVPVIFCLLQLPPNAEVHTINAAAATAPWRLRDSSDVQQLPQPEQQYEQQQQHEQQQQQQQQNEQHEQQQQQRETGPMTPRRPLQKTFVTRKNAVDVSCFFLLVESQVCAAVSASATDSPAETAIVEVEADRIAAPNVFAARAT